MRQRTPGNQLSAMLMFFAISVLTGMLVAGLGIPMTALAAGLTKTAADSLQQLPADLEVPPQPESSKMYLADGSLLANFYDEYRQYVPLDEISGWMKAAQVAIEDHRFYEHGAIDLQSVIRAAFGNAAEGSISGGGSTLTQQYVKLVRVQICGEDSECIAAMTAPKLERKIVEMRYAVALEQKLSKEEILERYLNIAYYGDGAYGVQSAARHYFGVDAKDLDLAQSALLAGLVQNPGTTDPVNNPDAALARRRDVLDAMVRYQLLDPQVASAAAQVPFDKSRVVSFGMGCEGTRYPFVCDYARRILISEQMPGLGNTAQEREQVLRRAGLEIHLTLDPGIQDAAQGAISAVVGPEDAAIAAVTSVDPHTGRILAMAQSRYAMGNGPGQTYLNFNVPHKYGDHEGFMMGSTFKAWTAAAAIQQGKFPESTSYNVSLSQNWNGKKYKTCEGETVTINDAKPYVTTNAVAGQNSGNFNMVTGMMWSVNNYWVQLHLDVSPCASTEMAERAGVELAWPVADERGFGDELRDFSIPSFVLGGPFVTVQSMATGYGTFANRGVRCLPLILDSVKNKDGQEIPVPGGDCQQTIDPVVADGVNHVLKQTHERGLSAPSFVRNGIDQASKTGTADDSQAAVAFVGYTRDISTAVVIAGDKTTEKWRATPEDRRNLYSIYSTPMGRPLGNTDGQAIWKPMMERVMSWMPESHFEPWVAPKPEPENPGPPRRR